MVTSSFPDSKFFIARAGQARLLAGALADPVIRDRMLTIADDYEKMAKTAEALKQNSGVSELKLQE
jgi:hypothetical protein